MEHVRTPLLKRLNSPSLCAPVRFERRVDLLGPLYRSLEFTLFERTFPLRHKKALWRHDECRFRSLEPASYAIGCGAGFPGGQLMQRTARHAFQEGSHRQTRPMALCWAARDEDHEGKQVSAAQSQATNQLWGQINRLSREKAYAQAIVTVEVNPHGTSQYCSRCGAKGERFSSRGGSRVRSEAVERPIRLQVGWEKPGGWTPRQRLAGQARVQMSTHEKWWGYR